MQPAVNMDNFLIRLKYCIEFKRCLAVEEADEFLKSEKVATSRWKGGAQII